MNEWRRGWRAVLGALAGVGFGISSLPFYTLGVFAKPVAAAFGWSRFETQLAFAVMMTGVFLFAPLIGAAVDRFGVRRIGPLGLAGFALAFGALAFAPGNLALWYLNWFAIALLGIGSSPVVWTRGIAERFDRHRGAATGAALAGSGLGALILPPAVTAVIVDHGWRAGYLVMAAAVLIVAVPLTWACFRQRPGEPRPAAATEGLTLRAAVRGYRFWLLMACVVAVGIAIAGIIPSLVPLLTDKGLTPAQAARYAGLVGAAVIAGRLLAGWLTDRVWPPAVAAVLLSLPAIGCWALLQPGVDPSLTALAAALAGLAAGAEVDLIALLSMRYFGAAHYGRIYGWQLGAFSLAAGIAPMLFGLIHDRTGSYDLALRLAALLFVGGALSLLALGRPPHFARQTNS